MIRSIRWLVWNTALCVLMVGLWSGALADAARAQSGDDLETEKITPYTGPPIYLDEPEAPPAATLVERIDHTEKYEDGALRVERQIARYSDERLVADGSYRSFFKNGQVFAEGAFSDGARDGEWTLWFENGTKNRTMTYKDGQPDGSWEVFREDGTLAAKRSYRAGKREGTWLYFDPTGEQQLREQPYADGKPDGVWKDWYPSGKLLRQVSFRMGERHGESAEWDEEGNIRVEANYADGKPHGRVMVRAADGREIVQEYENGKLISRGN